MMKVLVQTLVAQNIETVWENFTEELLLEITPSILKADITQKSNRKTGDEFKVNIKFPPLKINSTWRGKISEVVEQPKEKYFVDIGLEMPKPLASWHHRHRLIFVDATHTLISDEIEFSCYPRISEKLVYPFIYGMMSYRKSKYRKFFNNEKFSQ